MRRFLIGFYYSLPVQLLLNNLRRNLILVLCWVLLYAMITGNFGKYLGIPYLFLDPEYLNAVNFTSFFIMGCVTAGLTTAFHITTYIMDGHRFPFIGTLKRPFTKFALNNSVIPFTFLGLYIYHIIIFQINNQYTTEKSVLLDLAGLLSGYAITTFIFFAYFRLTNKDIFRYMVCRIDERIKKNVGVTRASALKKLDIARKSQVRVDYYLDLNLRVKKVEDTGFYDRATILQVFDQNHFNLVIIEIFIFIVVLILGLFKDYPSFQLPAAASFTIFLTIFIMLAGAFEYWFGTWAATTAVVLFLIINYLTGEGIFSPRYEAFGLNYKKPPVSYGVETLKELNDSVTMAADRAQSLIVLENWRNKFPQTPHPLLVLICVSGGGKRAALWTFAALQHADSLTKGGLMNHAVLITGASGGLVGASYFRELVLRSKTGEDINPYSAAYRRKISTDNLNPLIFSLLANDLFVGFTSFEYAGNRYKRDRAYTFEEQLDQTTEGFLNKTISSYAEAENNAIIPMLILSPTIVNDGRKLYIASRPVTYLNLDIHAWPDYQDAKIGGVDFNRLFAHHGAADLRFLSALRMCATFPYITPNTTLPTDPPLQIMDAGLSDNFGISDAVRFLFAFHEWIEKHTSGIIMLTVRDSPKLSPIPRQQEQTILDALTQPISAVYNNFENFQDISSDLLIGHAKKWLHTALHRIDIQYHAGEYLDILHGMDSIRHNSTRASLSWRLTEREKQDIIENLHSEPNKKEFNRLKNYLN